MSWTDERKKQMRDLWLDGKSATQIAKILGQGLSRNAILGMAWRMGISGENRPGQPSSAAYRSGGLIRAAKAQKAKASEPKARTAPRTAEAKAPERPLPVSSTAVPVAEPMPMPKPELVVVGQAVVMAELKSSCCKYPVGPEPEKGDMHLQLFCAAPTGDLAKVYCPNHMRVAYKPATAQERAKKLKSDLSAAHRDMANRNTRRHSGSSRAVF